MYFSINHIFKIQTQRNSKRKLNNLTEMQTQKKLPILH